MEEHTSDQILKNQEGTMYALGALAEVMQKMNERFDRQDEHDVSSRKEQEEAEIQKAESEARESFVSEIAQAVLNQVQNLNADKERSVSKKHSWPIKGGGTEDAQVEAKLMSDTDKVQMPLVASNVKADDPNAIQKHEVLYADEDMDESAELPVMDDEYGEEEEEDGKGYGMARKDHHLDDDDEEEEDEDKDLKRGYPVSEMKMLAKQLRAVTKELNTLKSSYGTSIESKAVAMTDATLQKAGWTKELSKEPRPLPQQSLGIADIQKSASSEDIIGQMASMSWNELNAMRIAKESGQTDGLPREIVEN